MDTRRTYVSVRLSRLAVQAVVLLLLLNSFGAPGTAYAYSVLSHEAVIDLAWNDQIVPLIMERFPATTPDQLRQARAYAYGGCIIQDIGYYPFGNHFFSDLLHYVRTGDFVSNLLTDATDANEFAFALGALAHYTSDIFGHPSVNYATGQEYPKLRDKFGNIVTYDDDPTAHLQTEFGFDVVEVAENRYAPQQYHDFIGFQVAKPLLERAFQDTYGFEVKEIMPHEDLAIGTYRHSVSVLIPKMTRVALVDFGKQIEKEQPGYDRHKLIFKYRRSEYRKDFGKDYQQPGVGSRVLAFFINLLPKVGPLRALKLRIPDDDSQKKFLAGMSTTVEQYRGYLDELRRDPRHSTAISLPDKNLDVGTDTISGRYRLADFTYAKLLAKITEKTQTPIPAPLRTNIISFYKSDAKNYVSLKPKDWQKTQADLKLVEDAKIDVAPVAGMTKGIPEQPVPAHN
jgi:Zinc dependent phospholipase C